MSSTKEVIGSISENGDFDWKINVPSDEILERDYIKSPIFIFSSASWYVKMHPNGESPDCREWISLFLHISEFHSEKEVSFSLDMTFQDVRIRKTDSKYRFKKNDAGFGFPRFILRDTIRSSLCKETYRGQLIIKIRMKNPAPCVEDTLRRVRKKGRESLRQNYRDMLLNCDDRDLVLKVKDKEFKVHSLIMKNRCNVFKSMLSHEMLEKNEAVVEIPDCDPLAFSQFLHYIYAGELSILSKSTMLGLYYIADKYDMENLKEACCAFIKKSLTVQIFCDVIRLAVKHSDAPLLEFVSNYFISNGKEICVTVEWKSFIKENPDQANELIIKTFEKTSYCCVCSSKDCDESTDSTK